MQLYCGKLRKGALGQRPQALTRTHPADCLFIPSASQSSIVCQTRPEISHRIQSSFSHPRSEKGTSAGPIRNISFPRSVPLCLNGVFLETHSDVGGGIFHPTATPISQAFGMKVQHMGTCGLSRLGGASFTKGLSADLDATLTGGGGPLWHSFSLVSVHFLKQHNPLQTAVDAAAWLLF